MPGPIKPALPAKWPPRPPRPAYAPKIPTIRTVSPVPGPTKSTRRRSFEVSRREPVVGYITRGSRGDVYVRALTYAARGRLRRASLGLYRGSAIVWGLLRGCDKLLKDAVLLHRSGVRTARWERDNHVAIPCHLEPPASRPDHLATIGPLGATGSGAGPVAHYRRGDPGVPV
jgi:hypothetical protein